jgi:hypothetical protein
MKFIIGEQKANIFTGTEFAVVTRMLETDGDQAIRSVFT